MLEDWVDRNKGHGEAAYDEYEVVQNTANRMLDQYKTDILGQAFIDRVKNLIKDGCADQRIEVLKKCPHCKMIWVNEGGCDHRRCGSWEINWKSDNWRSEAAIDPCSNSQPRQRWNSSRKPSGKPEEIQNGQWPCGRPFLWSCAEAVPNAALTDFCKPLETSATEATWRTVARQQLSDAFSGAKCLLSSVFRSRESPW